MLSCQAFSWDFRDQSLGASRKVSYPVPLRRAMTPCDEVDGAADGMLSSAGGCMFACFFFETS